MKKTEQSLLNLKGIRFFRSGTPILEGIDLRINPNEHWVLLGRNGAGKTTLVNLIYGTDWPTAGRIELFGEAFGEVPIQELRNKIGILDSSQQESALQRSLTVFDVLLTGFFHTIGYYRDPDAWEEKEADRILEEHGMGAKRKQLFRTLSSGEKKKVLFLRAMSTSPDFVILDEPCSGLDLTAREEFIDFLDGYKKNRNFTSIYITHRLDEIPPFYEHAALLKSGKILYSGMIGEAFTSERLTNLYDRKVLAENRNGTWVAIADRS
ncbi:ABC transporter, ATP-binding protein [Leptospira broomii serovar Hurstbridge str. 5399]|uniref:ABC transporter, ATP-binding protein n=1 Tax=Leptospira broomii serovar Hurstbridge str. 5399 TaxID=1049789 RepID=T0GJ86_9LEPT|nr:ATP-binding cassette domain-containing protein [Leptospira broomii]EQA46879.1 ABC transporter, ATP-binding protein [Leptospira broomii serovar Hurstbridge str. 5399]